MESKCPVCGAEMSETYLGWVCMNTSLENPCSFRIAKERLPRIAAAMELARAEVAASDAVWSVPLQRLEPAIEASEDMLFQAKMRVLEVFGGE